MCVEVMRGEKATIVEQSMQDKDSLMAAMHDFENQALALTLTLTLTLSLIGSCSTPTSPPRSLSFVK